MQNPIHDRNEEKNKEKPALWSRWFIMANLIQVGIFMGYFMLYSTIGIYTRSFAPAEWYVGLVTGIFTLASLATRTFSGGLLDRRSPGKVLIAGLILSFLACMGYLLAGNVPALLAMRIVNGLGYGLSSVAVATIISSMLPRERLLEGLGYSMMVSSICGALGPALSLNITQSDPARFGGVFVIALGVSAFSVLAAVMFDKWLGDKIKTAVPSSVTCEQSGQKTDKTAAGMKISLATAIFSFLTFFVAFLQSTVTACLNLYAVDSGLGNLSWFFILFAAANVTTRICADKAYGLLGQRRILVGITLLLIFIYGGIFAARRAEWIFIAALPFGMVMGFYYPLLGAKIIRTMDRKHQGTSNTIYLASSDLAFALGAMFWSGISGRIGGYRNIYLWAAILAGIMLLIVLRYPMWLKKYRVEEELW